jgi:putative transposase
MNKDKMEEFEQQLAAHLRSGKPLTGEGGVLTPLIKRVLEAAMAGELADHLSNTAGESKNRRNGHTRKQMKSSSGTFELSTPRDRAGTYSPEIVGKRQTYLPGDLDEKILALYSLGTSYRDIQAHVLQMYGTPISEGTITRITDQIIPAIRAWQERALERVYPIVWMDALYFKLRSEGKVTTKAVYSVLGLTIEGHKEVLGLYLGEQESATFWLQVLNDLKQRGVEDILIASIDNLKGFRDAILNIFPRTEVQLCVVHQLRNSLKYVASKYRKEFVADLKTVYQAATRELAGYHLDEVEQKWGKQFPAVFKSWRTNWEPLTEYFKYPPAIRKLIYTTNTVEGYHRMVRRMTKTKGAFTAEMAMLKLVYLATRRMNDKWKSGVAGWPSMLNDLTLFFGDRINFDTVH